MILKHPLIRGGLIKGKGLFLSFLLAACSTVPPPQPEFCQIVAPHPFSEATIAHFDSDDPSIAADRDWIADALKARRCLCGGEQTGCPE